MRKCLLVLVAALTLGFAPAPFPKPGSSRSKLPWVVFPLVRLSASVLTVDIKQTLGKQIDVGVDVEANTIFLQGEKRRIDQVIAAIKEQDAATR